MNFNQVEDELGRREKSNDLIRVGIAGTGFIGRGLVNQVGLLKGIKLSCVANRNLEKALRVLKDAGIPAAGIACCETVSKIKEAVAGGKVAVLKDIQMLVEAEPDIIVDCTGDPQAGAALAVSVLEQGIDFVAAPEMDSIAGYALNKIARDKGAIYSGADGDEPGVTMGLYRYVSMLGFRVVAAGKFKGYYDRFANPDTVKPWSTRYAQNPYMISSFADGTKMNIEMSILANASGLTPEKRGMHCPRASLDTVPKVLSLKEQGGILESEGVVEVIQGVEPAGGVFVVASTPNPQIKLDLQYFKMGDGPNYLFYRPYHLCSIEMVVSIIRVAIHRETSIVAQRSVAGVLTCAKKNLKAGDELDRIGGYSFYGLIDRQETIMEQGLLPAVFAPGARLLKDKETDEPLTFDEVEIDRDSILYRLWLDSI
jgi:predicted homoserine dehydrogenase-like protein